MKRIIYFIKFLIVGSTFFITFLLFYFKVTAPEGCAILQQYCFGDGTELVLESDYLPNSPVIQSELKKMRIGQVKVVRFHQKEDWRLSYALNPFHLLKTKNGFRIFQYIKFDEKGEVFTEINFKFFMFKVKDSWVNLINPTPFMFVYQYREK